MLALPTLGLPAHVGSWLLRLGLVEEGELEAHEPFLLKRGAAQEFENGVRVARLLQMLGTDGAETLDTLKDVNTPVAKLYNWNLLLPVLRMSGLDVDQDMKVLIVAGDIDIVADLLGQLHAAHGSKASSKVPATNGRSPAGKDNSAIVPPTSLTAAKSVVQFLAFCCEQQLDCQWDIAVDLARNPKKLNMEQTHGVEGNFTPIVRWYKLVFAHCKLLSQLCDPTSSELALSALSGGMSAAQPDVALWSSRVLCRLAAELNGRGLGQPVWQWFSGTHGGCAHLVHAWTAHPTLHAAGALMPLALHLCGERLHLFLSTVLPRHLSEHAAYLSFVLELIPLLANSKGSRDFMLRSGALAKLLQRAFRVSRSPNEAPVTRGLAQELLASLWSTFTREVEGVAIEPADANLPPPSKAAEEFELADGSEGEKANLKDASSQIVAELKRGCRDSNLELQLTAHMALFMLLDEFASTSHPSAPYLFNVLSFSLIENHHEPVLRQFLARNMQHSIQQQPFIPVGVLLKPLVKQATLYGYSNLDFDFFLTLSKHERLGIRHALLLLQFLGKVCLNDALHGRVATIPFLVLLERFHDSEVLHDFLEVFCEQALASLLPDTTASKSNAGSAIRSTLCIELVAKILHLPHPHIIRRVSPAVHSIAEQYTSLTGTEHPGLNALLTFAEKGGPPAEKGGPLAQKGGSLAQKGGLAQAHGESYAKAGPQSPPRSAAKRSPPKKGLLHAAQDAETPSPGAESKAPPTPASQVAKKEGSGYSYRTKPKPAGKPKPLTNAVTEAKAVDPPATTRPTKKSSVDPPASIVVPLTADEKELRAQELALEEQIKALDQKIDSDSHNKVPSHLSPLDRRELEIELLKATREAKLERNRLEEERKKLRSVRIKRRMRAKYEAKLKAAREGAEESIPEPPKRNPARKQPKHVEPAEPEPSEAELRRQRGDQNRRETSKRLTPAAIAKLEKELQEAEDPSQVSIPAGYKVVTNDGEPLPQPSSSEGKEARMAAVEALDHICFSAVGVRLQPLSDANKPLRVVPVHAVRPPRQANNRQSQSRQPHSPPPPKQPSSPPPPKQPRPHLPPKQPRSPLLSRQPHHPPAEVKRQREPGPHPRTETKSNAPNSDAHKKIEAPIQKKPAVVPPLIVKKRQQQLPEPPPSNNPMRADVQKYQKEVERLKEEGERNERLQARRAEAKAKLDALRAEKAAKEAEKQRQVEESELMRQAEIEKKRERDRKRQAMLKKKLDEYHKEQRSGQEDAFGNSGFLGSEGDAVSTTSEKASESKAKTPQKEKKGRQQESLAPASRSMSGDDTNSASPGKSQTEKPREDSSPDHGATNNNDEHGGINVLNDDSPVPADISTADEPASEAPDVDPPDKQDTGDGDDE